MRSIHRLIALPFLVVLALLSACSDSDVITPSPDAGVASVAVELESEAWGAVAPESHALVRVRILDESGGLLRSLSLNYSGALSGTFGPWEVDPGTGVSGSVEVEVLPADGATVLWSGTSDVVALDPGSSRTAQLTVYPGGLDQRTLTGLTISAPHEQLGIGEEWSLSAAGSGTTLQGGFWGSLDPGVAEISPDGTVHGRSAGTARIVHAAGLRADTLALPTREWAESIQVTPESIHFSYLRQSETLSADVLDFRGNAIPGASVEWSSSDPTIVRADSDGRVVARGAGASAVRASVGNASATVPVTVEQEPRELLVLPGSATVQLGQSLQLNASLRDQGGAHISEVAFSFQSDDSSVAAVNDSGLIRGESVGETVIRVVAGGYSQDVDVRVVAGAAARIQLLSGGGQTGAVDEELPESVRVRVIDGSGFPVPDRQITWVASNDGSVQAVGAVTTDSGGEARVRWRLGIALGTQTLEAFADDATPLEVRAHATPGPAHALVKVGGDDQSGEVASTLASVLRVEARDAFGFPVEGATIDWTPSGGGSVAPGSTTDTGSDGRTQVAWTLGTVAGTQSVTATLADVASVTFRANAAASDPVSLVVSPAAVALDADEQITLQAIGTDVHGNTVAGIDASWSTDDPATAGVLAGSGLVSAVWEGSATITANYDGLVAQSAVEVRTILSNGSFEDNGGEGTRTFTDWITEQTPSSDRGWLVQTGTSSPLNSFAIPAPPDGTFTSTSDQTGPGYSIIHREIYIPEATSTLEFELYYDNSATGFATPDSYDVTSDNQQFRLDLMDPAAGVQDFGAAILLMGYRTEVGAPLDTGGVWVTVSIDVTGLAGETVRLRFSQIDSASFLTVGIDDVRLERAP